jgi:hypothetical protein
MLLERIRKEDMYFNPILIRLGQFRLVRQLRQSKSGFSSP